MKELDEIIRRTNQYFEGNLIRSYPLDLENKSVFIDKNPFKRKRTLQQQN